MIDWDDLRFFLAVCRAGSYSAAARALGVTQPTVGRRLAAFEAHLGAELFVATPSGQAPTATGERLLVLAERMEADATAAERVASGRDAGLRGPVRITASEWLVDRVLAPIVGALSATHPGLELELIGEPRHLSLARREADLALRPSRFEHREVVEIPVAEVAFGLYASDRYLAERGAPRFDRQCEGHDLVAMSESLTKIPDLAWLPSFTTKARVVARANARLPMATLAAAGVGMACLPRFVGDATPALRLIPAPTPRPERRLWLAVHRDARSIPRVRATMTFLKAAIARLRPALCPVAS